jgi:hypothetical protein
VNTICRAPGARLIRLSAPNPDAHDRQDWVGTGRLQSALMQFGPPAEGPQRGCRIRSPFSRPCPRHLALGCKARRTASTTLSWRRARGAVMFSRASSDGCPKQRGGYWQTATVVRDNGRGLGRPSKCDSRYFATGFWRRRSNSSTRSSTVGLPRMRSRSVVVSACCQEPDCRCDCFVGD